MSNVGPPGWEPHTIVARVDGWFVNPSRPDEIPSAVAELIADNMPRLGEGRSVSEIRARMLLRQRRVLGD